MATYYEYYSTHMPNEAPSGTYSVFGNDLTVDATVAYTDNSATAKCMMDLSGDAAAITLWEGETGYAWMNGEKRLDSSTSSWDIIIFDVGLSGVTGIGTESPLVAGRYYIKSSNLNDNTYTPNKENYTFNPPSFTFNRSQGHGAAVTFVGTFSDSDYKVTNPDPADNAVNVNRITDLIWNEGESVADNYKVYFGLVGALVLVEGSLAPGIKTFSIDDYMAPEHLSMNTEYAWRVDSYVGGELVATGDIWSYTTRAQRTVVLSSPIDTCPDVLLRPLLEWTIDGIGAQYGSYEDQDFLFIYLKKDNVDFTENDLIGNFVQAFYNDNLQIVAGLEYDATYYWQVQGSNTAADLADSGIWSFTTTTFRPPAISTHPVSGLPIGENNMITQKRFVAAANNKIWYEDI